VGHDTTFNAQDGSLGTNLVKQWITTLHVSYETEALRTYRRHLLE